MAYQLYRRYNGVYGNNGTFRMWFREYMTNGERSGSNSIFVIGHSSMLYGLYIKRNLASDIIDGAF